MASRRHALIWAAEAAFLVLLAGVMLPIWTRWYVSSVEPWGLNVSLWDALIGVHANRRRLDSDAALWALHRGNLLKGAWLLAIAAVVGWAVFQFRRTRAAVWGWGLLAGSVLLVGLVTIFNNKRREEHLVPAVLAACYAAALLFAWVADGDSRSDESSGSVIDRLIALKRHGVLLARGRFRRDRRANRLANDGIVSSSDSQLDRLVARKHQFGTTTGSEDAR